MTSDLSQWVSAEPFRKPYAGRVKNHYKTPLNWGAKFRQAIKLKHLNLAKVAEKLSVHEATVRSWTNGHRDINLSDFLKLCTAAKVDPWPILFADVDEKALALLEAWRQADVSERKLLTVAAEAVLRAHEQNEGADRASDSS
jgi:transcriptional regulator with XRE-family HTH domain